MASGSSNRVLCGILGILFGGLGIHRFILGDVTGGIIRIVLSCFFGLGGLIGLVEGIIYLTKSDEEFEEIYVRGGKAWF
ncbi:NINE protein [bacterium]|nr:NINE protein [bacterium]